MIYLWHLLTLVLAVASDVSNNNCFGATLGSISLRVSGGTTPYTYSVYILSEEFKN